MIQRLSFPFTFSKKVALSISRKKVDFGFETTSNASSSNSWKYFNSPEDGAHVTKGWFKVVAPDEDNTFNSHKHDGSFAKVHAEDEDEKWYYTEEQR